MLFNILSGASITEILPSLLFSFLIAMFALSLHETAHGYVAWKCGDNTAYNLGRLTLNPIKHLDPIGFLCMLVFGFGWAKPVPINTRNFRNPKKGMALTALAGPLANAFVGAVCAILYGISLGLYIRVAFTTENQALIRMFELLVRLFQLSALYNFLFMAFNLIPIPPFDGSRIALAFLPPKTYFGLMKYERQIMFGLLIALLVLSRFGFSPFSWIAAQLTNSISAPFFDLMLPELMM